ncbi:hypothetical protein GCM10009719_00910 [Nocardioides kribbensis]
MVRRPTHPPGAGAGLASVGAMTSAGSDHDGPGTGTEPEPGAPAWLADDADPEYHLDGRAYPLTDRRFRDVVGSFASGLTVVTADTPEGPVGVTCQSFASVSLDPPLVLVVLARSSRAWPRVREAGRFCVNVLAEHQQELSTRMASRGVDKFAGVGWTASPTTGAPRLDGAVAHVDCAIDAVHEAGDHDVVVGRVLALAEGPGGADAPPLLFHRGAYRRLG